MKKMQELSGTDFLMSPAIAVGYAKKTITASAGSKWVPAGLAALFLDLGSVFSELFWIVVGLWGVDFAVGILRAWHDPETSFEAGKAYRSVLKLFVIGFGTVGVYLIERLILQAGIALDFKLVGAVLIVIAITEAFSVLDNLVYFWPGLGETVGKVKDLLGRARNASNPGPGDDPGEED